MPRVAILHPGDMGAVVGGDLVRVGADVRWLPAGRSDGTRGRAEVAGLREAENLNDVDLIISLCPPGAAVDVARSVAGFRGLYLDANAVGPRTAREIAWIVTGDGARYVDGAVIGPPPTSTGTTRLYLSGAAAREVAELFAGTRLETRVMDSGPYGASALKMTYAAWTKAGGALLMSARATAAKQGVEADLLAEWAISQPGAEERSESAKRSAQEKGWRWEAEMLEIARTFGDSGQPEGFGRGASEVFRRFPRPSS